MKLENGKAEEILASLITEWQKEGDIDGKTVNETNLERLVKARLLAVKFFDGVKDAKFELDAPSRIHSNTSTGVTCSIIEYEREKDGSCEKAQILQELITLVDDFSVSPITPASLVLRFGIDGIWQE